MKRRFLLSALLVSFLLWGVNSSFAQDQVKDPNVQSVKNMAVLTYNLGSVSGDSIHKWNCTEVYRVDHKKWKIIQTHWSLTKPEKNN